VLRPKTTFKLSLRLPPTVDGGRATAQLRALLEADPPYNARVTFDADCGATGGARRRPRRGWRALPTRLRMPRSGRAAAWMGEGGTIPFMNMLGESSRTRTVS